MSVFGRIAPRLRVCVRIDTSIALGQAVGKQMLGPRQAETACREPLGILELARRQ